MSDKANLRAQTKSILTRALEILESDMDGPAGLQKLPELTHAQARALEFVTRVYNATARELDPGRTLPEPSKQPSLEDASSRDMRGLVKMLKAPNLS